MEHHVCGAACVEYHVCGLSCVNEKHYFWKVRRNLDPSTTTSVSVDEKHNFLKSASGYEPSPREAHKYDTYVSTTSTTV